jgi:hypothetical protein
MVFESSQGFSLTTLLNSLQTRRRIFASLVSNIFNNEDLIIGRSVVWFSPPANFIVSERDVVFAARDAGSATGKRETGVVEEEENVVE